MDNLSKLASYNSANEITAQLLAAHDLTTHLPNKVIIGGASSHAENLLPFLIEKGTNILGVIDCNAAIHGKSWNRFTVTPIEELYNLSPNANVILATHRLGNFHKQILAANNDFRLIPFPLLSMLDRNIIQHPFYAGLHEDLFTNRHKIILFNELLADDKSRQVLDAVIGFRLTFDWRILSPIISNKAYFPTDIFQYKLPETYIDGGAYTGDTINRAIQILGHNLKRVVAFEPSPKFFAQLEDNFGGTTNPKMEFYNCGLSDHQATYNFSSDANRESSFDVNGSEKISVTNLDSVPQAASATLIKLNIEGAEIDALNGARSIIKRNRPKLAIAAYHRPDHLWKIAELIKEMDPSYKIYLRQHDEGIIETALYAV